MNFMRERLKARGVYHIVGWENGRKIYDKFYHNVISQLYFDALFAIMDSTDTTTTGDELKINVFATGIGTTAALKADTQLGNEAFRKSITDVRITSTTIQVITDLLTTDSNFLIKEVGLFAGGVVGTPNSGTLISHKVIEPINKTSASQYQASYLFTIQ